MRFRGRSRYVWLVAAGCAAEVLAADGVIGWVGTIHPLALQNFGIEVPVVAFELSVAMLQRLARKDLPIVEPPTYPGISIDLAIVVDEKLPEQLMRACIRQVVSFWLTFVSLTSIAIVCVLER